MGALAVVCAAGASAPVVIPSNASGDTDPATTLTETVPTETVPTDTTPAQTAPPDTTPAPTDTTPAPTAPPDTTPAQTTPPEDPPPPPPAERDPDGQAYRPPPRPTYSPPPAADDPAPAPAPAPAPSKSPATSGTSSTTAGPSSSPSPERCKNAEAKLSIGADKVEAALRCLVDAERYGYGLEPLSADSRLDSAALNHARDMASRGFFGHIAPDPAPSGSTVGDRVKAFGYDAAVWGENLAAGQRSAAEVVDAWMRSPSHREELLDGRFTQMGVGFATASDGRVRWAQVFARPAGEPEPEHPRLSTAARAAGGGLVASAQRRGTRIVVRGDLAGTGKLRRRIRITALKGTSIRSRTISVLPGKRFAASVASPARKGRIRVLVRVVGRTTAPLRLSV